MSRLLEAGLAEFDERGFQAVRVDDIVRRARTSHGTFYLYFSNKEDLFKALLRDALHDMAVITDAFPVVTRNAAGRAALRQWVHTFCGTYAAHSAVIRSLSQAELVGEEVWGDGLRLLFRLAEAMTQGMTAASGEWRPAPAGARDGQQAAEGPVADSTVAGGTVAGGTVADSTVADSTVEDSTVEDSTGADDAGADGTEADSTGADGTGADGAGTAGHAELTALACLMMLERVNYLWSVEVRLPREEMVDRLTAIMFAAFNSP